MTELGGSAPLSEARVEAGNWMTALTLARKTLGESGGVPPGASCSVAPDGRVTIHDALARKTYSLAPDVANSLSDRPPPKGPRVPLDAVPRPESTMPRVPRPSDPPSPRTEPAPQRKKVPQKTIAYDASELGIAPPAVDPAPAKKAPQKTIAYDASELGIAPPAVDPAPTKRAPQKTIAYDGSELGIALPPAEPASAKKVPQTTIAYDAGELGIAPPASTAPPAPTTGRKRAPQRTIAFDAGELGLAPEPAPQPPPPASTGAPSSGDAPAPSLRAPSDPAPRAKISRQTIAYDASELGLVPPVADRPASVPPQPSVASSKPSRSTIAYDAESVDLVPSASAPSAQQVAIESVGGEAEVERRTVPDDLRTAGPAWDLLHSRDEEPTKDSPLVYRERTYYVPEGTSDAVAEAILLARFDELRDDLTDRPKGKLVNMALFDHRWTERPTRPPLLTLQWKDWRGEPAIGRPNAPRPVSVPAPSRPSRSASAPPAAPPRIEPPPPASAPTDAPATLGPAPVLQPASPAPERRPEPAPSAAPSSPRASVAPLPAPPPVAPLAPTPNPPWQPDTPAASTPAAPDTVRSAPPEPMVARTDASLVIPRSAAPPAPAVPTPVPPPSDDDLDFTISDEPVRAISAGPDDRLATAFEALQDLFFLTTPVEGLDFVMRLLEDLIPSEAASACLYDINTDELRFVALTGPGAEERQGDAVPRLAGLVGVAALAPGEAILFEDVLSDERFDPGSDGRLGVDPESMALCAVAHGGRLLGLVQMINRRDQAQFSRADANLLTYIAAKLGEFLYEARMRPDDRQQL